MKQWCVWYRPRSLRSQLLLWLVSLHLGAAAAAGWVSYDNYGRLVNAFMDDQMRVLAESYAGNSGLPALQPLSHESIHRSGSFIVQFWDPQGRLQLSTHPHASVPLQAASGLSDVRTGAARTDAWRIYTGDALRPDGPRVQIVQSASFRAHEIKQRALLSALPIALLLPLSLFLLWGTVWTTSRTLGAVARDIAAQDPRSFGEIPLTRVPEEIAPLVAAFNSLLLRLRDAFATQRRFVQDAAHELRTPVAAISLQMENFRPCVPPGAPLAHFEQVDAGVRRTQRLIEQLLRLSRQDAPQDLRPIEPVDVHALLRRSLEQLMVVADRRRIDIGMQGEARPVLMAPAVELHSVFDNLIDNALRYAPEGGVVDVRLHTVAGRPVVDVVDDGPGIPPDLRERVFDRFFRVPGTAVDGSGLGLAIARTAAQRNGLHIELLDRPDGPGLLARVHLPT